MEDSPAPARQITLKKHQFVTKIKKLMVMKIPLFKKKLVVMKISLFIIEPKKSCL